MTAILPRLTIQRRKFRDIICDNGRQKVRLVGFNALKKFVSIVKRVIHINSHQFQVTRTQMFVMTMNSSTTNPYLPCIVEQDNLDFDAIVRDIVADQESVKRHIGTSVTSSLSVSG